MYVVKKLVISFWEFGQLSGYDQLSMLCLFGNLIITKLNMHPYVYRCFMALLNVNAMPITVNI